MLHGNLEPGRSCSAGLGVCVDLGADPAARERSCAIKQAASDTS
jgi:hypothetical protein